MPVGFADRLLAAIECKRAPAVVALDPVWESLPEPLTRGVAADDSSAILGGIRTFSRRVIEVIAPIVPAVKINSAYFERYHAAGVALFDELIGYAMQCGLITIADCKRGDVGHTAEMYARACLGEWGAANSAIGNTHNTMTITPNADAVTVNGYFGLDGVKPFIDAARAQGRGVFVLVRTSNPSAAAIQDIAVADGRKIHEIVAEQVDGWSRAPGLLGESGYSAVGAVVATRDKYDAARLRARMPASIFLVPGYGAQGGQAADFAPYFDASGRGALIAAGRSVIFAYREVAHRAACADDWPSAVDSACRAFAGDVSTLTGSTRLR